MFFKEFCTENKIDHVDIAAKSGHYPKVVEAIVKGTYKSTPTKRTIRDLEYAIEELTGKVVDVKALIDGTYTEAPDSIANKPPDGP